MNSITFRSILKFLDECTNTENLLTEMFKPYSEQELQDCVKLFCHNNNHCWVNDTSPEMDLEKSNNDLFYIGQYCQFSLKEAFSKMGLIQCKKFWVMFNILIGRRPISSETVVAVQNFCNDLQKINIEMDVDSIINIVANNRGAISTRFMTRLDPAFEISPEDQHPFWDHMQNVWNCMYPDDMIHFKDSKSHQMANSIFNSIGSMQKDIQISQDNPQGDILNALQNSGVMGKLTEMFNPQSGISTTDIKDLFVTLVNAIPDNK